MAYYYSGTSCTNSADTYVFSSDLAISLPTIVSFTGNEMLNPVCVTLTSEVPSVLSSLPIVNTFTTCQDCMRSLNPCPVFLTECESGQVYPVPYSSIYSLPFVPQTGNVYLVTVLNGVTYTQSCFFIERYTYSPGGFFCKRPNILYDLISISPSSFGLKGGDGCEICQNSSPSYWRVKECISNTEYIISLSPGTNYQGYAITFTIDTLGIDLYCGVIIQNIPFSLPTSFVSSIIGYVGEGSGTNPEEFCVSCVASGATKVLISNCLDGSTEVIWGSNLFNPGDVSNISLGGGQCYEVLSATTAPVTINELLNYEPSPTCTDCLNCEQVELFVQVCGDITAFPIISSQYVPFGTIISDGSTCYEVQNASPVDVSGVTTIVSFATFNTCPECEDASFQRWVGTSCNDGHADFIVLTGTSSYVPGQIVQVQRNGSDFTCYTLQYTAEGEVPPLLDTPNIYYSLTQTPYNTCAECSSGSTVGITIIDCDYASASYVTVSLYDYLRLTGGDGNPATPVLQYDGKCHLLLNECPIDNTYPLVTSNLYNNCIECSADLDVTRYSGTTCFGQEPIIIAYNETNILTPGDIVITNGGTCVTISGITELTNTEGTITTTGLTSCYECYLNDDPGYYVFFQSCLDGEIFPILLSSIGLLPLLGVTYFLDFTYGKEQILHQTCFTVIDLQPQQPDEYMSFNSISLPYVDCAECFTNNLIRYRVQDCVSGDIHVIGYPSTGLENLVTYTPIGEVDQYCGNILEITTSEPIDSSLITILGKVDCEECLSAVAKKRILTNCLNGNQEVVWGSLLFAEGNITHIQTGEGCYEIGPETELEVTINEFLDFDNYPSCQECIQCNGVHYFYSACTPEYNVTSVSSLSVGFYNTFITYQSSTNIIFVTDSFNRIALYDATTNVNLNNYYAPVQIQTFFFLHPTNGLIYFVNSYSLYAFNTSSGAFSLIYNASNNIRNYFYDPITNFMWLTIWGNNISIINLTTNTLVTTISLPYYYTESITYNPNNDKVYVEDFYNPFFYVIDRISYTYTTHNLGYYYSNNIIYDNTTNRIFGNNHYIDCATLNVFNIDFYSNKILIDPISNYLLGWGYNNNQLGILNPTTLQLSRYLTQSTPPNPNFVNYDITYNSNTNEYYASTIYYNSIVTLTLGDLYRLGEIDSYQYAPLDSYFHHPKYGCSIIYDILPSSGVTSHSFYSFENFDTCEDCTNVQFDVWGAYNCVTNRYGYVTTQSGLYTQNDLVNVKWGETDFVCYRLDYLIPPQDIVYYNINRDNFIAESLVKPTCENCSDGVSVSISIIDCSNQNSMFVNVSLSLWFILTGYNDTIPRPVFLFGDTCYRVLNECPFSPDHYPINPTYLYYNCESCGNPLEANSETVLCLQNCSGGTYTVSVNHPYWTNQYGMAVIQNNAVGLGGQTGYNA